MIIWHLFYLFGCINKIRLLFVYYFQKIRGPELSEKIMKECSYLKYDPTALSMLQDPELFLSLIESKELNDILDKKPAIGRLAQYLVTLMTPNESASRSHHVSYSLDSLSDEDEEMETEQLGTVYCCNEFFLKNI